MEPQSFNLCGPGLWRISFGLRKGKKIDGLKEALEIPGITIFHAGTKYEGGEYYTNGGRVVGVCASEDTLAQSLEKAYEAIAKISFEGMHFRRDIGTAKEGAK